MDLLLWAALGVIVLIFTCVVLWGALRTRTKAGKEELESRVTELEKKFQELQKHK
ncbi:hypothetical protein KO561_14190 [Radiobacillus kanasensis]|uniref:hypothetical protein n=1 Tax=Radiobacillus kanasensis TaxID=2844358 RepID=UPI001E31AB3D|nr:hypothetical protein [Radiobacillus kanasensis]UFT98343.1 hypothetical protein KO561_14190 [Radiobacillus kanasensis]